MSETNSMAIMRISSQISNEQSTISASYQEIEELAAKASGTIQEIKRESSQYTSSTTNTNGTDSISGTKANYTDGDIIIYTAASGKKFELTYSEIYGAFIYKSEFFANKSNITDFMLTDASLKKLGANVIFEFVPNVDYNDQKYFGTNYDSNSNLGLRLSGNDELPISRIYNIDNGENKIYFEFEQFWAIGNRSIGTQNNNVSAGSSCLLCSLINAIPQNAQESYNSSEVIAELNNRFEYVLNGANKHSRSLQNVQYTQDLYSTLNKNTTKTQYIAGWDLNGEFNNQTSYVVRITTDSNKYLGQGGEKATDGNHNIAAIPDGKGGYYLLDPNNFVRRKSYHHTPHVSRENLIKAAKAGSLKLNFNLTIDNYIASNR